MSWFLVTLTFYIDTSFCQHRCLDTWPICMTLHTQIHHGEQPPIGKVIAKIRHSCQLPLMVPGLALPSCWSASRTRTPVNDSRAHDRLSIHDAYPVSSLIILCYWPNSNTGAQPGCSIWCGKPSAFFGFYTGEETAHHWELLHRFIWNSVGSQGHQK